MSELRDAKDPYALQTDYAQPATELLGGLEAEESTPED